MTNDTALKQLSLFDVEEWKPVVGYEEYYIVSNHGNVMRVAVYRAKIIAPLKPQKSTGGYHHVNLSTPTKGVRQFPIHKLVMQAFVGERPKEMRDINHIDGNKTNNRLDNLEYCTRSENNKHAYSIGLRRPLHGTQNNRAKLTQSQVDEIRQLYSFRKTTMAMLAAKYGVNKAQIFNIIHHRSWGE